jgi:L-amino acid N-acyltransferase YncA
MSYVVRRATPHDADAIYRIWIEGAERSLGALPVGSDETDLREYFRERLTHADERFPFFVVEDSSGDVVSWQSLSPMRKHPAVAGTMAELSAYTSPRGTGRATLLGVQAILRFADESQLHYVMAFINSENAPALRFAAHFGLQTIGVFPSPPRAPHLPPLTCLAYLCQANADEVREKVAA